MFLNSWLLRHDRCMEEGAEEFLLKPVKLSDVRRLKDFIMRGKAKEVEKKSLKRMRSIDCSPPLSATYSSISLPCDPSTSLLSTLSSKKARLWSQIHYCLSPILSTPGVMIKACGVFCICSPIYTLGITKANVRIVFFFFFCLLFVIWSCSCTVESHQCIPK